MSNNNGREPMLDMFIFETLQLVEQLEQLILNSEKCAGLESSINEIFRIMHTIKGSAAMMMFNNISSLAHSIEDALYYIRENKPKKVNYSKLTDIVLDSVDFIKNEVAKIEDSNISDGDASNLVEVIKEFLSALKSVPTTKAESKQKVESVQSNQKFYISSYKTGIENKASRFRVVVYFEEGCEMENIRAFSIIHNLKEIGEEIEFFPKDIIDNPNTSEIIKQDGFQIIISTDYTYEDLKSLLSETLFARDISIDVLNNEEIVQPTKIKKQILLDDEMVCVPEKEQIKEQEKEMSTVSTKQNYISVNITKMDVLMDLVGELVISEAMVTQNPDLKGLILNNFNKSARQLRKITSELQDIVMSVRMVPLSSTFQKMNRILRDMSKKLNKEVQLEITGEETEVDKNIIEHISDPLMHIIRNSIDHGIETANERQIKGKSSTGKVILEARNAGGEVWIIIKDDGKGLDKEKILMKARKQGLVNKPETELTDKEIYSFVLLPGFSTKENITEFSGRGVGMDVVAKNIESVRGTVTIDSIPGGGTTVFIKIPLTLAIIDGVTIRVGSSVYTVPTTDIRESFRLRDEDVIRDMEGNEMLLIRGECYPLLRINELYKVESAVTQINEGIIMMVENESKGLCLFADELIGEQQVVVKALPRYVKKVNGIAGCTLLGDGSISLILDVAGLTN